MTGAAAGGALAVHAMLTILPAPAALLGDAWLLKGSLSIDGLFGAVEIVRGHLVAGDLPGARQQVAWHLVSRPTDRLEAPGVASAAIESLAENVTDGLVAPVCFYVAGALLGGVGAGLALAWAYRAVNTADAMIGYRRDELEYLGRATARTDDALNYVPARMAAASIVVGAWLAHESRAGAARGWRRDAARTESPNAGQTMAAMAGALGVTLEKSGHYRLGDGPPPDPSRWIARCAWRARAVALDLAAAGLVLLLARCRVILSSPARGPGGIIQESPPHRRRSVSLNITDHLADALRQALDAAGLPAPSEVQWEIPREARHGDYATNVAMTLAREARRPPRKIAEAIVATFPRPRGGSPRGRGARLPQRLPSPAWCAEAPPRGSRRGRGTAGATSARARGSSSSSSRPIPPARW